MARAFCHFFVVKNTEKVTKSLDNGANYDNNWQPVSPEPTQGQVGALGPPCLCTVKIKFEFILNLFYHHVGREHVEV